MSLIKSLENAGVEAEINLKLIFIEAESLELNE
jgi:CTP synthase (UTP-ammonia lyase)